MVNLTEHEYFYFTGGGSRIQRSLLPGAVETVFKNCR